MQGMQAYAVLLSAACSLRAVIAAPPPSAPGSSTPTAPNFIFVLADGEPATRQAATPHHPASALAAGLKVLAAGM